ncbi:MAG TPA: hypothetical protein VL949_02270 [Geobacteraceae bacterium]|nr:hypothetical protein [Geobacteraceae bacterium]
MKRSVVIACAVALLAIPLAATAAEEHAASKKGRVVSETMVTGTADVKAIDLKNRTVTLMLSNGKEQTFVVDKAVKKLNQVKVGDTVMVGYYEAVSIKINKTKVAPGVSVEEKLETDAMSAKPAGAVGRRMTTTATIDKIFDDGKMVTLRMPNGTTADVKVRDKVNLEKLKKGEVKEGDQIEITYTQALAVSVEKMAHK